MKRAILLTLLAAPLVALPGTGSPTKGKRNLSVSIGALQSYPFEEAFRGGERACVIVKGDHQPVVDVSLSVFDEQNNLIAKDEGGGDIVAVVWYPPRDGTYRFKVHNSGREFSKCYISLK